MSWQNPKMDWNAVNIPGPSDFNRIEANIDFIENSTRTPSDAKTPAASGSLLDIQNYFASMIKKITGKSSWIDTPRTTLENAVKRSGDTMTGRLEVNDWVSLKGGGDLVLEWLNNAGERQGYIGRIVSPADDSISIRNSVSGKYLDLYDSGLMNYSGNEFRLGNGGASRKVSFQCSDGVKNPLAWIEHDTDLSVDKHKLIFNSVYSTQIGYADFEFLNGNVGIQKSDPEYPLDVNGIIRADGARPIHFDPGAGWAKIKGNAGGWATGYFFEGSEGAFLGGFGAHGGTDALNYYYIGIEYNNPLVKIEPSITTFSTAGRFNTSVGEALRLGAGASDHTYLSFYPRAANPDVRGGWIGYGSAGTNTLFLQNALGDIDLEPQSDTVNVNGKLVTGNGAEALALKPGSEDYTYLGFYPRTSQSDVVRGYLGYGSPGTTEMTMANYEGDVRIITQDKLIVQGKLEADGEKVPIMKKVLEGSDDLINADSPERYDINVSGEGPHFLVYDVYAPDYYPVILGYHSTGTCAYIETRASAPRLVLKIASSTRRTYNFVVYELII